MKIGMLTLVELWFQEKLKLEECGQCRSDGKYDGSKNWSPKSGVAVQVPSPTANLHSTLS